MIIPCYNEEKAIGLVLSQVPKLVDEVIVVDNNSTDQTAAIAKQKGAQVKREKRQGYGYSIAAGLKSAKSDLLVVIDGDGTYPIQGVETLLSHMLKNKLDFLSTSRFPLADPKAMKLYSRFGNWVLTSVTWILFRFALKDSQSGMWLLTREAFRQLNLKSGGMGYSEEIKIKALKNKKINFGEKHIHYQRRLGQAKLKAVSDGVKNLALLFKLKFLN